MILSVVLRNYKVYKNINYIPITTGGNFTGMIGYNGIGKSSILEALDSFFNGRQWQENLNHGAQGEDASYVSPIFLIDKNKITDNPHIADLCEKYSNVMWGLVNQQSMTTSMINTNYREYIEALKSQLQNFSASSSTHYLLPIAINSNYKNTLIFKGDYLNPLYDSADPGIVQSQGNSHNYIVNIFINPIYEYIKNKYDYIYIPKDVEPERIVQFETREIQSLIGDSLENIVSGFLKKQTINELSKSLKDFVDELSDSLPNYKFKVPSSRQPNLKPSAIYGLIIREFFSLRELHKTGVENGKDLPMKFLSSGEKQQAILETIHSIVTKYRNDNSSLIIGIDEPEASLHVSACYDQFEKLSQLSKKCSQVLFTSHWYGFIPAMLYGNVIYLHKGADKHEFVTLEMAKYREELKFLSSQYGKMHKQTLPIDVMLKSTNDFVQSIISSIVSESPYNWLICEGSSELEYLRYYFRNEIESLKLRIIPVGGAGEIQKLYTHLSHLMKELKSDIRGNVVLIMDTDAQLQEFETSDISHLYCKRLVNDSSTRTTKLVNIKSNPKSPKTEIEDVLNGKVFYEALKLFKSQNIDTLHFVKEEETKEEVPSYYALDLSISSLIHLQQLSVILHRCMFLCAMTMM